MNKVSHLLVFLSALLSFSTSLGNQFAFDDRIHILENSRIRSLAQIPETFSAPMYPGNLYRPLVEVSYTLTYRFFGLAPLPYHLTNILLHATVALLAYVLLLRLFSRGYALAAALLFAVHPLCVEVVANVSGRSELLCALFGLLSVMCALSANTIGSALLLFLALLSKESAFVFALLIPLALYYRGRELTLASCLAILFSISAYLALRVEALGSLLGVFKEIDHLDNTIASLPIAVRVLNAVNLLGRYAALGVFPLEQSADYSFAHITPLVPITSWKIPISYLYFLPFSFLLSTFYLGVRARGRLAFGATWFLAAFLVTSNVLFPIGTIFAERLCYLPLLGLLCVVASISSTMRSKTVQASILAVTAVTLGLLSAMRSPIWRDDYSLTSHQIAVSPLSAKTQLNYGAILVSSGQIEQATKCFTHALEIAPNYPEAMYALGAILMRQGKFESASEWLSRSLTFNSSLVPSLNALGSISLAKGDTTAAQSLFERSLQIRPDNFPGLTGFFELQVSKKEYAKAAEILTKIKALYPGDSRIALLEKELPR